MTLLYDTSLSPSVRVVHVVVGRPVQRLRSRDRLAAVDPSLARLAVRLSNEIRNGATSEQLAAQF